MLTQFQTKALRRALLSSAKMPAHKRAFPNFNLTHLTDSELETLANSFGLDSAKIIANAAQYENETTESAATNANANANAGATNATRLYLWHSIPDAFKEAFMIEQEKKARNSLSYQIASESSDSQTMGEIVNSAISNAAQNWNAQSQSVRGAKYDAISIALTKDYEGNEGNAGATSTPQATAPTSTPQATAPSNDNQAAQLLSIIQAIAGATMNPAQIKEMIDAAISEKIPTIPTVNYTVTVPQSDGGAAKINEIPSTAHKAFPDLLWIATSPQHTDGESPCIWIVGPTGSGKSHGAKQLAKALNKNYFATGAVSQPHEILGFVDAGGVYRTTEFRKAYESDNNVFCFDEIDAGDSAPLLTINMALANGEMSFPDKMVTRGKGNIFIGTANTTGQGATSEYVGRAKIDGAILSRFPCTVEWEYDEVLEARLCGNAAFAHTIQAMRKRAADAGLKVILDTRKIIAGAALLANPARKATVDEVLRIILFSKMDAQNQAILRGATNASGAKKDWRG